MPSMRRRYKRLFSRRQSPPPPSPPSCPATVAAAAAIDCISLDGMSAGLNRNSVSLTVEMLIDELVVT